MSLEKFKEAKQRELDSLRQRAKDRTLPRAFKGKRGDFKQALRSGDTYSRTGMGLIAEFKQASPSRGVIAQGFSPEEIAAAYSEAGASCLSILTEDLYFGGDVHYPERIRAVGVETPLLRKDFIFDPLQVIETISTPVSALLLIVRLTPDPVLLRALREQAELHSIDAVVEIFNLDELLIARESGARIIQVNARDLDTLEVDTQACLDLAREKESPELWIAASGMKTAEDIAAARHAGFDAVLIGTGLMEEPDPGDALKALIDRLADISRS